MKRRRAARNPGNKECQPNKPRAGRPIIQNYSHCSVAPAGAPSIMALQSWGCALRCSASPQASAPLAPPAPLLGALAFRAYSALFFAYSNPGFRTLCVLHPALLVRHSVATPDAITRLQRFDSYLRLHPKLISDYILMISL
jgi:hypothetical protein